MFTFGFVLETRLKRISVHKRELNVDNIDNADKIDFEFSRQKMTTSHNYISIATVTKCDSWPTMLCDFLY